MPNTATSIALMQRGTIAFAPAYPIGLIPQKKAVALVPSSMSARSARPRNSTQLDTPSSATNVSCRFSRPNRNAPDVLVSGDDV